ncbi:MAG TPA: hypothetical protein VLA05_07615 [Coriobacteriia bacterium]|nr:hypothetical protein [Coriobacteriia bacterium]
MLRVVRIGLIVAVAVLAVLAVLAGILVLRPDVTATSSFDPDVTIECAAATGVGDAACVAWGDAILGGGSPSTTFEARDVVRLRLDRELLGFGDSCRAEWFLGRYPEDVAWSESVPCADG